MSYIHYSSSLGNMVTHLSFATKYRHRIFAHEQIKRRCLELFHDIAKQYGMKIHELAINVDHVHILVDIGSKLSVADAVQLFKGITARELLLEFPWLRSSYFWGGHLWSPAYFFGSVGEATYEAVSSYVRE